MVSDQYVAYMLDIDRIEKETDRLENLIMGRIDPEDEDLLAEEAAIRKWLIFKINIHFFPNSSILYYRRAKLEEIVVKF